MAGDAYETFFTQLQSSSVDDLTDVQFAEEHFLNPRVPRAIKDDPTGEIHRDLQITGPQGEPMTDLVKDQPIPLRLRWYQREVLDAPRKWRVLRFGRRCMVGDTPVLMSGGYWKRLGDIEAGDHVVSYKNGRITTRPVSQFHRNGVQATYEIRFEGGRSVIATANHPFLLEDRETWLSVEDGLDEGACVTGIPQTSGASHVAFAPLCQHRVTGVFYAGHRPTYDVTVEDTHNFIAEGLVAHNTGKSFLLSVEVAVEALRNPNAQVLIVTPNESHVKVLFDDYIRPLFRAYRHRRSGMVGLPSDVSMVGDEADFAIEKNTQKPQEITIVGEGEHLSTIRGMVISDSARGQSASKLVVDEADYADDDLMRAVVGPIIMTAPNTEILMGSTPSGRRDSYYYEACHNSDWKEFHHTFKVLPHYDDELHARMARMAGGEDTNTFKQEYLAEFGTETEGVFDQEKLGQNFIVSPYCKVLEEVNERTRERKPLLAYDKRDRKRQLAPFYEGVKPMDWPVPRYPIGAQSIYRPEYTGSGVVTVGTDWNDVAGMQTVMIWWPPLEWLRSGKIDVAQFRYRGVQPVTTDRAKNERGVPRNLKVGLENGDPGGPHDLSQVRGIVIWHGRLESGKFSWISAANRVCALMSIPRFIDTWYVDQGYGSQVNQMILQIMETGQYMADMEGLSKTLDIPETVWKNIRQFHPDQDPEHTGKRYQTVEFGAKYDYQDIDFKPGKGRYKDVMVNLARRMVSGRHLLFPYGRLVGYYDRHDLGDEYDTKIDATTGDRVEVASQVTDDDKIEENGADPARGEGSFGGLITQMQSWRVDGYTPTGRPRYSGIDHAIDAFMLAVLAYFEQHSKEGPGNMFRHDPKAPSETAPDIFNAAMEATRDAQPSEVKQKGYNKHGAFNLKNYSDERAPLDAILSGERRPEDIGHSLQDMIGMLKQHSRGRND